MKLWEILKFIYENKLNKGDQFEAIGLPFEMIIEYDGNDLVYANIMGNTIKRDTVSLCSGEMSVIFKMI